MSDTLATVDPDELIKYANDFVQELKNSSLNSLIKEIQHKIDESAIDDVISVFYDNLPLFLSRNDYDRIDTLIAEGNIKRSLQKNYNVLISPASMVLKKYIIRDPFGITYIILDKLRDTQFADEYSIQDGYIFTRNKKNLLIFITCTNPSSETAKNSILLDTLDSVIQRLNLKYKESITASYYGGVAVAVSNATRIKEDVILTVILSIILLQIFISLFIKIRWAALLALLPAIFGGLMAMAVLYILKGKVSSISLGLGSVLLGIGVDYGLYIFSYIKYDFDKNKVIKQLAFPLALCALTTISVYYCLVYVQVEVLNDLGLFMAFSVLGTLFFSITFLPYLIRIRNRKTDSFLNCEDKYYIQWLFNYRFDENKTIALIILLVSVIFFFSSNYVGFDSDMQKMNYMTPKLKEAEKKFNSITNFSLKSVYIVSSGKNLDEALQVNDKVYRIIEELKNKNVVKGVSTLSTFISSKEVQQKRLEYWNGYWTLEKKQLLTNKLIAESAHYNFNTNAFNDFFIMLNKTYTILDSSIQKKLYGNILSNFIVDTDSSQMIINLLKVDEQDKAKIFSTFSSINNVTIADKHFLSNQLLKILIKDFTFLINISSIVVLIILILSFGRVELGIIAFIPMILSWVWLVGIMGLLGIKFTIFNIIISTIIFSTGIDYTILILRSLQQDYAYGIKTLSKNKYGIFLSSSTTIISIGVLFFAQHPAIHSIALLPIFGYFAMVILVFTIEPIMVSWLILKRKNQGVYPVTLLTFLNTVFAYTYFLFGCLLLTGLGFIIAKAPIMPLKKRKDIVHICMRYFCKSMIYIMINVKKKVINESNECFENPAIIVCNHQSVLDILLVLMLNNKLILLTNDWVWNSPFFGKVVQYAQFYPVSTGIEKIIPNLADKVKDGYSIVVFPEGTRSTDSRVHRFHKGAFYIAEKLNLDILPIVFHGTGDTIKKGELWVRNGSLTVKILARIERHNFSYGTDYSERTKSICKYFRSEFEYIKSENETTEYFKDKLIKNYIYKETILEWYLRIKLKLENNYSQIIDLVPIKASVTDIGCGYGFLSYMLNFTSSKRNVLGIDNDKKKIDMANNCFSKNDNINFVCKDIVNTELPKSDVFILFDVLHYLKFEEQKNLLLYLADNLNENGIIIIRDANSNLQKKHYGTRLTEYLSTSLRFNKMSNKQLYFTSDVFIFAIANEKHLNVQVFSNSKLTSNQMFILKKMPVDNFN